MRSEIRVVADNGQEVKFDLDQATPLTPQAGRAGQAHGADRRAGDERVVLR